MEEVRAIEIGVAVSVRFVDDARRPVRWDLFERVSTGPVSWTSGYTATATDAIRRLRELEPGIPEWGPDWLAELDGWSWQGRVTR